MFGSQMIEVLIGLGFLFFLLSVIVTTVREFIEGLVQTRAVHLERGIRELLRDPDGTQWAKALYAHPQISSLFRGDYDPVRQLVPPWLAIFSRRSVMATKAVAADKAAIAGVTPPTVSTSTKTEWGRLQLRSNLPAYIPARNFATAMLDLTGRGKLEGQVTDATAPLSFAQIRAGIAMLPNPTLQRALLVALDDAKGDIDKARANLEAWYDSTMDRVSGWYRKETQTILFTVGLVLAVALNVDAIRVANALSQNQTLRETIVARARESVEAARKDAQPADETAAKTPVGASLPESTPSAGAATADVPRVVSLDDEEKTFAKDGDPYEKRIADLKSEIDSLGYPIGWVGPSGGKCDGSGKDKVFFSACTVSWASPFGWLITAFALTLGAPFWFDVLNKLMVIRSTVKPHEKSGEEASADRSTAASAGTAVPDPAAAAAVAGTTAAFTGPPPDDPALNFVPHAWNDGRPAQEGLL